MHSYHFRSLEVRNVSFYRGKLHNVLILEVYPPNKRARSRFILSVVLDTDHVEIVGKTTINAKDIVSGWGYLTDHDTTTPIKKIMISVGRIKIEE